MLEAKGAALFTDRASKEITYDRCKAVTRIESVNGCKFDITLSIRIKSIESGVEYERWKP